MMIQIRYRATRGDVIHRVVSLDNGPYMSAEECNLDAAAWELIPENRIELYVRTKGYVRCGHCFDEEGGSDG